MNIRLNTAGVLKVACALFLASTIGCSAAGANADDCFATRLDSGDTVIDIGKGRLCDAEDLSDSGRGRPGMRFMVN